MKLLLTGDIHLGRSSSDLKGVDDAFDGSAAGAWARIVELALSEQVAAVLVSGDLVDAKNRYFEATAPLERGVSRLTDAGIKVVAVAGNHDYDVTPALFRSMAQRGQDVRLLGKGGVWEAHEIREGGDAVRIVGWSFPSDRVGHDPTSGFPIADIPPNGVPTIGLVHGDLDVRDSPYAGLSTSRLESFAIDGWLLGHIHARSLRTSQGSPWILYPGSPQALDAGEQGPHGAWLVETNSISPQPPRFVSLSTVQYGAAELSVSAAASADEVRPTIEAELLRRIEDLAPAAPVGVIIMDVALTGESSFGDAVREASEELLEAMFRASNVDVKVRGVTNRVAPALALDTLVHGSGIAAALARAIVGIERGDPESTRESADLMRKVMEAARLRPLKGMVMEGDREVNAPLADSQIRNSAAAAARRLLAAIIDRGGADSPGRVGGSA